MKSIREIFDLRNRKALRMGILVLSTLLIGGVSAAVYYSLQYSTVASTSSAVVKFVAGSDCPTTSNGYCSVTIPSAAATYASLSIKTYPNVTVTYQRALNISNTDASNAHNVRIRNVTITGGSSSYSAGSSKLEFDLLNAAGTQQGKLVYTGGGTWTAAATGNGACLTGSGSACPGTVYASLPANTQWTLQIVAVADAGAATSVATTIYIAVDVQ